jgi:hypothetical protein
MVCANYIGYCSAYHAGVLIVTSIRALHKYVFRWSRAIECTFVLLVNGFGIGMVYYQGCEFLHIMHRFKATLRVHAECCAGRMKFYVRSEVPP